MLVLSLIIIISKIITVIWNTYYAYYWYTPFQKVVDALKVVSNGPMMAISAFCLLNYFLLGYKVKEKDSNDDKNRSSKNKIVSKLLQIIGIIIFIICVGEWIIIIGNVLISPFRGASFWGNTYYGLDALSLSLMMTIVALWRYPMILVSLVYIIIYLGILKKKKKKEID